MILKYILELDSFSPVSIKCEKQGNYKIDLITGTIITLIAEGVHLRQRGF